LSNSLMEKAPLAYSTPLKPLQRYNATSAHL